MLSIESLRSWKLASITERAITENERIVSTLYDEKTSPESISDELNPEQEFSSSEEESPISSCSRAIGVKNAVVSTAKYLTHTVSDGIPTQKPVNENQLNIFYNNVNEDRIRSIIEQFTLVIKHDNFLGWLTDLRYQVLDFDLVDIEKVNQNSIGLKVLLAPDLSNGSEVWIALGDTSSAQDMTRLLASGWPKKLKIVVSLDREIVEFDSAVTICFFLAHQVGAHFAPYWQLLEKALIRNRLTAKEASQLQGLWENSEKTRIDHRELHRGFLTWRRFKFSSRAKLTSPSNYRNIIELLSQMQFKGANRKLLWEHYCADVASYNPFSGKRVRTEKQYKRQLAFYTEYERYARRERKSYPWVEKFIVYRGLLFGFACCSGLSVLAYQQSASIGSFIGLLYQWVF